MIRKIYLPSCGLLKDSQRFTILLPRYYHCKTEQQQMRKENGAVTERIPYSRVGFYNGKIEHNLKRPQLRLWFNYLDCELSPQTACTTACARCHWISCSRSRASACCSAQARKALRSCRARGSGQSHQAVPF